MILEHNYDPQTYRCWQKEEDEHLPPPVRSFDDDDDLWRSMEDLMMMH